jgi:glycosyltransferase involved in cell wall biosynthesis
MSQGGNLPKISVVLPVRYVREDWLRRSIESVLAQDYAPKELVVVNDEATRDIDSLVASYGITKYVKNDRNRKLPYSLNRGFEAADGELHTWTSADNYMLPGMLARLAAELRDRPELGVVCGRSVVVDEHDQEVPMQSGELRAAELSGGDVRDLTVDRAFTYYSSLGACFMYRCGVWRRLGGYDESIHGAEDYDFWIRAGRYFRLGRIPWEEPPYYAYRVHSDSISATATGCYTELRLRVLESEAGMFPGDRALQKALSHYRRRVRSNAPRGGMLSRMSAALRGVVGRR